jgi:hypothetical protein
MKPVSTVTNLSEFIVGWLYSAGPDVTLTVGIGIRMGSYLIARSKLQANGEEAS